MSKGRSRQLAFVAAAVSLLLGACSSSGTGRAPAIPSTTGAATTTTSTAPTARAARPSAGCRATAAAAVKPGETRVDLTSDGVARWYVRHVPPRYRPTKPIPVVFDLHGYSSGAAFETEATGLGKYGDTHDFVTITPEGSGDPKYVTWDTALGSADVKFFAKLLDHVEHALCIDTRRVFVTGYSQGAFMTSTLACVYADRVAAVATNAGLRDTPGCKPTQPVPVVAFHGTADRHIAYRGGLGPDGLKLPAYDGSGRTMGEAGLQNRPPLNGAAIPVIAAAWAARNGCVGAPTTRAVSADVTLLSWPCAPGKEVDLYRIAGGGHTWPGSPFTAAAAGILGRTTMSISADEILWRFFRAHPLRDPS